MKPPHCLSLNSFFSRHRCCSGPRLSLLSWGFIQDSLCLARIPAPTRELPPHSPSCVHTRPGSRCPASIQCHFKPFLEPGFLPQRALFSTPLHYDTLRNGIQHTSASSSAPAMAYSACVTAWSLSNVVFQFSHEQDGIHSCWSGHGCYHGICCPPHPLLRW